MDRRLSWLDLGSRPALFPALFLTLGAFAAPVLPVAPSILLIFAVCATCASLILAPRTGTHVVLLFGCLLGGSGLSGLAARTVVPARFEDGGEARVEGVIAEVLRLPDGTARIDLDA